jgi:hypothetical protein
MGLVARHERVDDRARDRADDAHVVGLGLHGRSDTGQEGRLLRRERVVRDVLVDRLVGVEAVDHQEVDLRELRSNLVDRVGVQVADADDRVGALGNELLQPIGALGVGLTDRGLGVDAAGTEVADGLLGTGVGGVVEGVVAASADIEGDGQLDRTAVLEAAADVLGAGRFVARPRGCGRRPRAR